MYLKRKIDDYLLEWKKNMDRLPLIIKGARQIGKTESGGSQKTAWVGSADQGEGRGVTVEKSNHWLKNVLT